MGQPDIDAVRARLTKLLDRQQGEMARQLSESLAADSRSIPIDSLYLLELVCEVENEFRVSISDERIEQMSTVDALVLNIAELLET